MNMNESQSDFMMIYFYKLVANILDRNMAPELSKFLRIALFQKRMDVILNITSEMFKISTTTIFFCRGVN